MRILVLEDETYRIDKLESLCPSAEVVWVTTPWDFAKTYKDQTFDLVILDRDLDLPISNDGYTSHTPTGEDVLGLIRPDQRVLIWSLNVRAPLMAKALKMRANHRHLITQERFGEDECYEFLRGLNEAPSCVENA